MKPEGEAAGLLLKAADHREQPFARQWPRALATKPKLLLADESLGGLDRTEMERSADLLDEIRSRLSITIIWVEHIMGVLMRVVDRVIVLDHGEKIFEGKPAEVAADTRVTEVYLGKTRT